MKTKYEDLSSFLRDNEAHWKGSPRLDYIKSEWDSIEPLTVSEAFLEPNTEKRRVLFGCLGPARIFKDIKPTLIDEKVLKVKNRTWDDKGNMKEKLIEDRYELYEMPLSKLFPEDQRNFGGREEETLKIVRCWCTSTGREYWIFVDDPFRWWMGSIGKRIHNAIQAIAWTFRVGIPKEDIEEIYRQGDCLVVKAKELTQVLPERDWYHLDEETYIAKLVAQS